MSCPAHEIAKSRKMLVVEDVDLIIYAAQQLPKDRTVYVVDLGFGESGTSTLAVFAGRGEDIRVVGIDSQVQWGSLAVENIGQTGRFQAMENSIDEVPIDEIGPIDLLLVDCLPDETERVLRSWLPKLQPEGYVWVHDYGDPAEFDLPTLKNEAVARGIEELVGEGLLTKVMTAGLGWLGHKGKAVIDLPNEEAAKQPEQDPTDISEKPTAEVLPEALEPSSNLAKPPETSTQGDSPPEPEEPAKRKAGRPRGSKNRSKGD